MKNRPVSSKRHRIVTEQNEELRKMYNEMADHSADLSSQLKKEKFLNVNFKRILVLTSAVMFIVGLTVGYQF